MTQGLAYAVDIVLCVDATGSMGPILTEVKQGALRFHADIQSAMTAKDKTIAELRLRVIAFRDFFDAEAPALELSPFFVLPDEQPAFSAFVNDIQPRGGGDNPESGLEALAEAMRSPWTKSGHRRRHIIVVWTDDKAHALERSKSEKLMHTYPTGLPANLDELTDLWEGQGTMESAAKRLIIYAPDSEPWTQIGETWGNTVHFPSQAAKGLEDHDYKEILDAIASSV